MKNAAYVAPGFQPRLTRPELIVAGLDKSRALPTRILMRAFPVSEQSEINPD
ncbi:MAG: hypothetical protein RL514_4728 [Verrucomicrobiota bacterium]|jgi:hypothetical protein